MKILLSAVLFLSSFSFQNMEKYYLRTYIAPSVVLIAQLDIFGEETGTGTGFAVLGKNGVSYIVTNKHVCGKYPSVNIYDYKGVKSTHKVLKLPADHDLCIIEGDSKLTPLTLTDRIGVDQTVYVIGHPLALKLSISEGSVLDIDVCHNLFPTPFQVFCKEEPKEYLVTAVILSGNSGSPLVDKYGRVLGVVFAGDSGAHDYGNAIPSTVLKDLLSTL